MPPREDPCPPIRFRSRLFLAGLAVMLFAFGSSCAMPEKSYVQADRAKFKTIAPAHRRYVLADPKLDEDARQARLDALDSWEDRITAAERSLGITLPTTPTRTAR